MGMTIFYYIIIIAIIAFVVWKRRETAKLKTLYSIVQRGIYNVDKIASTAQMNYEVVVKRLTRIIDLANSPNNKEWALLTGSHIDHQKREIVMLNNTGQAAGVPANQQINNSGGNVRILTCSGCGSETTVRDGTIGRCEYCGAALTSGVAPTQSTAPTDVHTQSHVPVTAPAHVYGQPISVNLTVNTPTQPQANVQVQEVKTVSGKSRGAAFALCIFLGFFGGHMFYVGRAGMGVAYIFTMGFFLVGVLVDFFRILGGRFKDKEGLPLRNW